MTHRSEAIAMGTTFVEPTSGPASARPGSGCEAQSNALLCRVRSEYREMPGLRLTAAQAERLWQLDHRDCEVVLGELVDSGFLARTPTGMFVRSDSGA